MHYILNEADEPVLEPDLMAWAEWYETADRKIAETYVGEVRISTVFLGLDHNFLPEHGPPVLYETMIFDPWGDELAIERYATRDEAVDGHERLVERQRVEEG